MQEMSRYGVGIDIGTTTVRCVVGHLDGASMAPNIVGVGQAPNSGMRKGMVVTIVNVAQAIDKALEDAERMSGHQVHTASVNVNGAHISAMTSKGVVAVGASQGQEITEDDLARAEEAATVVQLPANREILQVTPRSYQLDGQENIKDPIGMSGIRLEVDAHVITGLTPHIKNVLKAIEMTETKPRAVVVSALAAARAVLTQQQMENGVAVIDLGGTTTSVVVFEEGDLQHLAVLPIGGVNITNDLAIGLRTDLDIAEKIKLAQVTLGVKAAKDKPKDIKVEHGGETLTFKAKEVNMIVEARLEEIIELVDKELKQIDRSGKLPGGVVLVGGGANLDNVAEFVKDTLRLPARVARFTDMSGLSDKVNTPEFATALGLMMLDFEKEHPVGARPSDAKTPGGAALGTFVERAGALFKKFKA